MKGSNHSRLHCLLSLCVVAVAGVPTTVLGQRLKCSPITKAATPKPEKMLQPPNLLAIKVVPNVVFARRIHQDPQAHVPTYLDETGALLDGYYNIIYHRTSTSYDLSTEVPYLSRIGHIQRGLFEGKWENHFFGDDQDLDYCENYSGGILHGLFTVFNRDKSIRYQTKFQHGSGHWKTFFVASGKLRVEGEYRNGQKTGTWLYYNAAGKVTKREQYDQGRILHTTPVD